MNPSTSPASPVIVITGSGGGIGNALARALLAGGCRLVLADLPGDKLDGAKATIAGNPGGRAMACDVREIGALESLWNEACAAFGCVDIWINNAGVGPPIIRYDTVPAEWLDRAVDVNLRGTLYGTQVALKGMLRQGRGRIYNVVGLGYDGRKSDRLTVYGTTKAAVRYFTDSVAQELRGEPVTVSWLNPGFVLTPMTIEENRRLRERVGEAEWQKFRRLMNAVADEPGTAGADLAARLLRGEAPIDRLPPLVFLRRLVAAAITRPEPLSAHGL